MSTVQETIADLTKQMAEHQREAARHTIEAKKLRRAIEALSGSRINTRAPREE